DTAPEGHGLAKENAGDDGASVYRMGNRLAHLGIVEWCDGVVHQQPIIAAALERGTDEARCGGDRLPVLRRYFVGEVYGPGDHRIGECRDVGDQVEFKCIEVRLASLVEGLVAGE